MNFIQHHSSAAERSVEIVLIVVNYNSEQETAQLLDDALRQTTQHSRIAVVIADNSPDISRLGSLRARYRGNSAVRFETMPSNLGYLGAAHCIIRSLYADRMPDWIIVSNADIRLPQVQLCDKLAQTTNCAAVLAPRIVSSRTGLDQNPFHRKRPSAFRMFVDRIIFRVPLLRFLLRAQCAARRWARKALSEEKRCLLSSPSTIYAPHGAFVIFNRKYFERGGTLNVGAFLFAEEKFIAETCRRLNLDVVYMPTLQVIHDEHVSTGNNPAIPRYQAIAADYLYREFFRRDSHDSYSHQNPA